MNRFYLKTTLMTCLAAMLSLSGVAQNPAPRQPGKIQTPTFLADYFTETTTDAMLPDEKGFIQRWMLLEPIDKPNRTNTVFTDSYLLQASDTLYFKIQYTVLPKNGDKV